MQLSILLFCIPLSKKFLLTEKMRFHLTLYYSGHNNKIKNSILWTHFVLNNYN